MFSFLFNKNKQASRVQSPLHRNNIADLDAIIAKLKEIYSYGSISEERKLMLKGLIEENGYLPYPHIKALEELTPAETIYGLEQKWAFNNVYRDGKFYETSVNPCIRAGYKDASWINKEQHNLKLVNLAALGNGNESLNPGKFIDRLKQILILPAGKPESGVLGTTVYLIPFHPREFGCAYLPTSSDVSPNLEDKLISANLNIDAKEQVKLFIQLAQLAGHSVIYDVLPQTGRYSKAVLSNPQIARWYDVKALMHTYKDAAAKAAQKLKKKYDEDDVDVVLHVYKSTLASGSDDISENYQEIYEALKEELLPFNKQYSNAILSKESQDKLIPRIKELIALTNYKNPNDISKEEDITDQGQTIQNLIESGLWPAPGGAWCSCGVPIFIKMSECGDYPVFKHFDIYDDDVTHYANLDCQTPFYFVHLETGEYNNDVIDFYVEYLKNLQKEYNFDGYRIDHIDHIVDTVSETDMKPISYRAPRVVLSKVSRALKQQTPHFALLAEYMLWDKLYKEYHQDMGFDVLWGDDIISQYAKTPEKIIEDNHTLQNYNSAIQPQCLPLSVLKTYNNQDGEFKEINQYPGQLGENGALFKWLKYKFLPGGKLAQRPSLYIDGDESFTKTGVESVIGAEISLKREKNYDFYYKFKAINDFALQSELTREGEAQILTEDEDGFVAWLVSKDPLKEALLVVANYMPPIEKKRIVLPDDTSVIRKVEGKEVTNKVIKLPCDYSIVSQYVYSKKEKKFVEKDFAKENSIKFGKIQPSEFFIYRTESGLLH